MVNEVRAEKAQRRRHKSIKFYGISLFVLVLLVVLAIIVTQLGTVFNLIGAIGANVISTGLPALFYFVLVNKLKVWSTLTLTQRRIYYLSIVFFAWSILLMIVCVGSEILKMHDGSVD
jgi:amino acid permease